MSKTARTKLKDRQFWEIIDLDLTCCFCGGKIPLEIMGTDLFYKKPHITDDNGYLWCLECSNLPTSKRMQRMIELAELDEKANEELNKLNKKIMKRKVEKIDIQGELF